MKACFFYKPSAAYYKHNPSFGGVAVKKNSVAYGFFEHLNGSSVSAEGISNEELNSSGVMSCLALRLADFILNFSGVKKYPLSKENGLSESFYRKCLEAARGAGEMADIPDDDTLLIAMKQMMHILRAAGIAKIQNGKAFMEFRLMDARTLYFLILDSFWNAVKWADIFPSDEDAANSLMKDRSVMADIISNRRGKIEINDLTNEFFDMTGFAAANDIRAVSFIDFYMFFWLKNFKIINYFDTGDKIFVELTGVGKKLLSYINK